MLACVGITAQFYLTARLVFCSCAILKVSMWDYLDSEQPRFSAYSKVIKLALLGGLVLLLGIILYPRLAHLSLPSRQNPVPEVIPNDGYNPDEDWLRYQHPQLPLQFYYPPQYSLISKNNHSRIILTSPLDEDTGQVTTQDLEIIFDFYPKSPGQTLEQLAEQIKTQQRQDPEVEILDEYSLKISNQPAYHWTAFTSEPATRREIYIVSLDDDYALLIQKQPQASELEDDAEEILSLIKILN